ncbi:hypothetical protein RAHE111665_15700 [Rariglobus hedericola]
MLFRLTARERYALGLVALLLALGVLGLVIL